MGARQPGHLAIFGEQHLALGAQLVGLGRQQGERHRPQLPVGDHQKVPRPRPHIPRRRQEIPVKAVRQIQVQVGNPVQGFHLGLQRPAQARHGLGHACAARRHAPEAHGSAFRNRPDKARLAPQQGGDQGFPVAHDGAGALHAQGPGPDQAGIVGKFLFDARHQGLVGGAEVTGGGAQLGDDVVVPFPFRPVVKLVEHARDGPRLLFRVLGLLGQRGERGIGDGGPGGAGRQRRADRPAAHQVGDQEGFGHRVPFPPSLGEPGQQGEVSLQREAQPQHLARPVAAFGAGVEPFHQHRESLAESRQCFRIASQFGLGGGHEGAGQRGGAVILAQGLGMVAPGVVGYLQGLSGLPGGQQGHGPVQVGGHDSAEGHLVAAERGFEAGVFPGRALPLPLAAQGLGELAPGHGMGQGVVPAADGVVDFQHDAGDGFRLPISALAEEDVVQSRECHRSAGRIAAEDLDGGQQGLAGFPFRFGQAALAQQKLGQGPQGGCVKPGGLLPGLAFRPGKGLVLVFGPQINRPAHGLFGRAQPAPRGQHLGLGQQGVALEVEQFHLGQPAPVIGLLQHALGVGHDRVGALEFARGGGEDPGENQAVCELAPPSRRTVRLPHRFPQQADAGLDIAVHGFENPEILGDLGDEFPVVRLLRKLEGQADVGQGLHAVAQFVVSLTTFQVETGELPASGAFVGGALDPFARLDGRLAFGFHVGFENREDIGDGAGRRHEVGGAEFGGDALGLVQRDFLLGARAPTPGKPGEQQPQQSGDKKTFQDHTSRPSIIRT